MKLLKLFPILLLSTILLGDSYAAKKKLSPELEDLFQGPLLDSKGKEVSKDVLAGKTIGLYFSAHWCPPVVVLLPNWLNLEIPIKKTLKSYL